MNTQKVSISLFLGLFLCGVQTAAASDFLYTFAVGNAWGDYGFDADITTLWMVNRIELRRENWSLEATIPVIRQNSSDLSWVGGMPMPRGMGGDGGSGGGGGGGGFKHHHHDSDHHPGTEEPTTGGSNTGLADPIIRFRCDILSSFSGASKMSGSVVVKTPLGDEASGFSTGEWDYGAGLQYSYSGYQSSLLAELTYWRLGDPPETTLNNPLAFRLAGGLSLSGGRYLLEGFLGGQTEIVDGTGSAISVGTTIYRHLTARHAIFASATAGLTDAASDFSVSAGVDIVF